MRQLREIKQGFADQAAKAAYRIAGIYREDKEEKEQFAMLLREVIKKYPGTAEAVKAKKEHDELGVPLAFPEDPLAFPEDPPALPDGPL